MVQSNLSELEAIALGVRFCLGVRVGGMRAVVFGEPDWAGFVG